MIQCHKQTNDHVLKFNNKVSQVSANDEATNDNTNSMSFDLNVQNLMPLIDHLKQ